MKTSDIIFRDFHRQGCIMYGTTTGLIAYDLNICKHRHLRIIVDEKANKEKLVIFENRKPIYEKENPTVEEVYQHLGQLKLF